QGTDTLPAGPAARPLTWDDLPLSRLRRPIVREGSHADAPDGHLLLPALRVGGRLPPARLRPAPAEVRVAHRRGRPAFTALGTQRPRPARTGAEGDRCLPRPVSGQGAQGDP